MRSFFEYFQLAGLVFFVAVFMGRTLYLRVKKQVNPFTLGVKKDGLQRIVELSFFVGLTLWAVEVLLYALPTQDHIFPEFLHVQLIDALPFRILGVILELIGFFLFVWALISFGESWRVGIDTETQGELVTTGAFAISRNPIFVFLDLYFLGTFLINGTLLFLLFAIAVAAGLHYQIVQEEKFLAETYGQAYKTYRARTRRYLG